MPGLMLRDPGEYNHHTSMDQYLASLDPYMPPMQKIALAQAWMAKRGRPTAQPNQHIPGAPSGSVGIRG